jgi:hypothetical protein
MLGGDGTILDLSQRGCRITSEADVPKQTQLEMRIHISDEEPPIEIDTAEVIWSDGHEFGLEFKRLQPKTFDRLSRLINSIKAAETA